jgi:alkylation response protein AidB-like acyl-CoA dehydrogenase
MDLELTDEQTWLAESVETLLQREWPPAETAHEAGAAERRRVWDRLTEFGALGVDAQDGLGAVELVLIARALGAHLASTPYVGSAAVRYAVEPWRAELGDDRIAIALLEPGRGWSVNGVRTTAGSDGVNGSKVAVEHAAEVDRFAVVASGEVLALVDARAPGVAAAPEAPLDVGVPVSAVTFEDATAVGLVDGPDVLRRLAAVAGLLAAAESVGAAGRMLDDARRYAAERRQFERTIGSNQALRHILADMYVRTSSSWSTVLYAAAALDDDLEEAEQSAAISKAYVARAAREVAHGALQVFGGIAFTQEHQAHRFLRRIVVREQQYGDARYHERELGRALAARASAASPVPATPTPVS